MFEPNPTEILQNYNAIKQVTASTPEKKNGYRYLRNFDREIVLRFFVYNDKGEWRKPVYKHFSIVGNVVPCIDQYSPAERLAYAESLFWSRYQYDAEINQRVEVSYDEKVKQYYYDEFLNLNVPGKYNPSALLKKLEGVDNSTTIQALRSTAQYLLVRCPICAVLKALELEGVESRLLSRYKVNTVYVVNAVDVTALREFDRYVTSLGYSPNALTYEEVERLAPLFADHYAGKNYTILPCLYSMSSSFYTKFVQDLVNNKNMLSWKQGTNSIIRKKNIADKSGKIRNSYEYTYELSSVNTPLHQNENVMRYIANYIYDLSVRITPPSLKLVEKAYEIVPVFEKTLEPFLLKGKSPRKGSLVEKPHWMVNDGFGDGVAFNPPFESVEKGGGKGDSFVEVPAPPVQGPKGSGGSLEGVSKGSDSGDGVVFKYKDIALRKSGLAKLPDCYGDASVLDLSTVRCLDCPVNVFCSQEPILNSKSSVY